MKALKIVGILLIVVILVGGGLIFFGIQNLNGLVKAAVERVGSDLTNTEVTLEEVNIELLQGRGEMINLRIHNPQGYDTDYAIFLGTIALQVNPGASSTKLITIDEVLIDRASIIYEEKNITDSNLRVLSDNVKQNVGGGDAAGASEDGGSTAAPNIKISKFKFSDADIQLVSQEYGERTINFPTLTLSNLGGENGLPPNQLGAAILDAVLDQARDAAKKAIRDRAREAVRDKAGEKLDEAIDKNLSDEDKKKLEGVRSLFDR